MIPNRVDHFKKIREEQDDYYTDDDLFKISSWGADLSFRELIEMYKDGDLYKPELQRKYVWDKTEASRFIDSLLLGLPVPSIFLAKTRDEKLLIVDGYQRIMTVYDYVTGIFSGDNKVFKLSKSEKINQRWAGNAFNELQEHEQRKIRNTTIHSIVFQQKHPDDADTSYYQIFERINTSGRTLFPQEIRNCIYQGSFNTLLFELNKYKKWRQLFGREEEDQRMRDLEMILRFFALSSEMFKKIQAESISLKKFLNLFMGQNRDISEREKGLFSQRFTRMVDYVYEEIGINAFNNLSMLSEDKFSKIFSPTIFDSIAIATDELLGMEYNLEKKATLESRLSLLSNSNYKETISKETMTIRAIKTRISLVKEILYQGTK